jgi:hypothetical protein
VFVGRLVGATGDGVVKFFKGPLGIGKDHGSAMVFVVLQQTVGWMGTGAA